MPIERLLNKEYAAGRVETLCQFPQHVDRMAWGISGKSHTQTLHVATADGEGNVVSITITQGREFGSCFTVPETGIILGHGMCRLDPRPGRANSVAPGKRPLKNGSPLLVRLTERDVVIGMPGGRRILCVATMLAQQVIDFDASAYEAAISPRLHVLTDEPVEALDSMNPQIVAGLRELGHQVEVVD